MENGWGHDFLTSNGVLPEIMLLGKVLRQRRCLHGGMGAFWMAHMRR